MPSIDWDNTFCTGIPLLDVQNKHFVERVNLLFEHQHEEWNKDFICQIFHDYLAYTQNHFRQEELFYEQHDPQELYEHREQHFLFQENLNSLFPDVMDEGPDASRGLSEFIRDWTVFHILHVDKNIACSIRNSVHF